MIRGQLEHIQHCFCAIMCWPVCQYSLHAGPDVDSHTMAPASIHGGQQRVQHADCLLARASSVFNRLLISSLVYNVIGTMGVNMQP